MLRKTLKLFLCVGSLAMVGAANTTPAHATLIDFEGLADRQRITSQFAGVVFSSFFDDNFVTTQPGVGFGSNFICTGNPINCAGETILTFTSPVHGLSFYQVGDDSTGVVAKVDVFTGGLFNSTVDILGFNTFNTPDLVDLTGFSNVTSIRIYNITDPGGLGWDNFAFATGDVGAATPLPAALPLFVTGLGGIGLLGWRRKKKAAVAA
jgi:hypothetical protein